MVSEREILRAYVVEIESSWFVSVVETRSETESVSMNVHDHGLVSENESESVMECGRGSEDVLGVYGLLKWSEYVNASGMVCRSESGNENGNGSGNQSMIFSFL